MFSRFGNAFCANIYHSLGLMKVRRNADGRDRLFSEGNCYCSRRISLIKGTCVWRCVRASFGLLFREKAKIFFRGLKIFARL